MDVPPSVERCKTEIRKKGAKLEGNRKITAWKRARMAQQDMTTWSNPMEYQENSFEKEGLRIIQAVIDAKNTQKKRDPWNLPPAMWRSLTREQQKLWIVFRKAVKAEGTKFGTPSFKLQSGHEGHDSGTIHQGESDSPRPKSNRKVNQFVTEMEEEINPIVPEDPEQAAFEEDNLSEDQKCWLARVRMLNSTRTVVLWHLTFVHHTI